MVGRLLNFGNVFVRTFTGTGSLTLTDVNRPDHMKKEIEELLMRVRVKAEATAEERIRYSIRQSLGIDAQEVEDDRPDMNRPEFCGDLVRSVFHAVHAAAVWRCQYAASYSAGGT